MSQPIETTRQQIAEKLSRLPRALERHEIPTIGTGRRARLEPKDLETLKAKERTRSNATPREPERVTSAGMYGGGGPISETMRNHLRRRLAQINRRSPIEKATSPLKIILSFTDLGKTTRQMDMLRRALEEARAIVSDDGLDESQKRVNLRKTLKVAASAMASHKNTVTQGA
jgi:hypothetical protein